MFAVTVQDLTLPVNLHVAAVRVLFTIAERLQHTEVCSVYGHITSGSCINAASYKECTKHICDKCDTQKCMQEQIIDSAICFYKYLLAQH